MSPRETGLGASGKFEPLRRDDVVPDINATVGDFWAWALGDPRTNRTRGLFTEWLIAQVLGLPPENVREDWADWDLLWDDLHIEVKTTGVLQAWRAGPGGRSPLGFSGLKGHRFDETSGQISKTKEFKAHIYVFCAHDHKRGKYDLTDPEQWEFWVMTRDEIADLNQTSVRLSRLRDLRGDGCRSFAELRDSLKYARERLNN